IAYDGQPYGPRSGAVDIAANLRPRRGPLLTHPHLSAGVAVASSRAYVKSAGRGSCVPCGGPPIVRFVCGRYRPPLRIVAEGIGADEACPVDISNSDLPGCRRICDNALVFQDIVTSDNRVPSPSTVGS